MITPEFRPHDVVEAGAMGYAMLTRWGGKGRTFRLKRTGEGRWIVQIKSRRGWRTMRAPNSTRACKKVWAYADPGGPIVYDDDEAQELIDYLEEK